MVPGAGTDPPAVSLVTYAWSAAMTVPDLGPVGLWTFYLELQPADRVRDLVPEIEAMGWGCVWVPEAVNRDAMVNSALLLSASSMLKIGTGIASIWGRDAMTTAASLHSLSEAWPGRFVLGLGVSHQPMVDHIRGQDYSKPFSKMRDYVAAMDAALYMSPKAEVEHVVLAALGPKMLELAAAACDGAHPYFVPVEHTAFAREHLGPDALLAPEQAVVLSTDADVARRVARGHMATYLTPAQLHEQPAPLRLGRRRPHRRWERPAGRRHRGVGR